MIMTARQLQARQKDSQGLRVLQSNDNTFFVESAKGKILYIVTFTDDSFSCACGDFVKNIKTDENFHCKHIIGVKNAVNGNALETLKSTENKTPKLDERFITTIKGKDFVVYSGLLSMSHEKGIKSLKVEILQYPSKENGMEGVCQATLESKNGEIYCEIGDATPKNVNRMVSEHILHMAATRSKARVMRDYVNVGLTALEELTDMDDVIGPGFTKKTTPKRKPTTAKSKPAVAAKTKTEEKKPEVAPKKVNSKAKTSKDSKPKQDVPSFSEAQKRAIYNLSRRRGISVEDLDNLVMEDYDKTLDDLSSAEASDLIRSLQQAA
jgi:predicted nucleic acid-binding Zn finger protein